MEPPRDAPPVEGPPPEPEAQAAPDPYRCRRCGAPHDPLQEYCLECGARLAGHPPAGVSVWRREAWTRESPFWFWAAFLALLLIALIAGAIVLAATNDDEPRRETAAQGPTTSQLLPTELTTAPLPTTTAPVVPPTTTSVPTTTAATTTGQTTTGQTTTGQTTTGQTTTGGGTPISWPSGKNGYTIVLESVPDSNPRSQATAKAEQAIARGLDEVGVLDSSDFSSLNPGFWVVFSGIYDTESEATTALPAARQAGYPVAYIRRVAG